MARRLGVIAVLAALVVVPVFVAPAGPAPSDGLVVHEWGTFTSIAGENGRAEEWLPLAGPADLPCFVEGARGNRKGSISGTVRMETPVIYFYSPRPVSVDVRVRYRQGLITEFFPRPGGTAISMAIADAAMRGELAWRNVRVVPGGSAEFPLEPQPNHYYVARHTDAAPLHVGAEQERFLFYRGVGHVPPPIAATVSTDGQIVVSHSRGEALGDIVLFQNRDGATAYQALHTSLAGVTFNPLTLRANTPSPRKHLEQALVAHGLYLKEAKAMVESWQGSWFEHGTRLFYIVSGETIDEALPLQIDPAPSEKKRVFVGRIEIVTSKTLHEVKAALERNDRRVLAQYGRFLDRIGKRLLSDLSPAARADLARRIQAAYVPWQSAPSACAATTN